MTKIVNKKPTKADIDREIMIALKNFINANTCDYLVHIAGSNNTKNELTYLASRSKRAGVDRNVAWDYTRTTLGKDMTDDALNQMKERFDQEYDNQEYEEWWTEKKFWYVK